MKRIILILLLFITKVGYAQVYNYIGVENGLSNRRVYSIQKDKKGYMWFLTHDGIDRFDGKRFKHYKLTTKSRNISTFTPSSYLLADTSGEIWEINENGQFFKYNSLYDKYVFMGEVKPGSEEKLLLNYAYIDKNDIIWLCTVDGEIYLYDIKQKRNYLTNKISNELVNSIAQISENIYYIATSKKIYKIELKEGQLKILPQPQLDKLTFSVNVLYYLPARQQLYIGSLSKGLFIYDLLHKEIIRPEAGLEDICINNVEPLNKEYLLIATQGGGVYKIHTGNYNCEPYIVADYNIPNGMNGNNIIDLYVDEEERIWMANYPIGITVLNNKYPQYKWIKHALGNKNSLVNDQVNAVIEDSDGDLWFATNNGISLYEIKRDKWTYVLSSFNEGARNENHIFLTICEIVPGVIFAGGHTSGIYWIDKKDMKPHYFIPAELNTHLSPDKYICTIYKDSEGYVWCGGYYNLKCIDIRKRTIDIYSELRSINIITERDSLHLWIGTDNGLYLLNKANKQVEEISLPTESNYINAIYQDKKGLLYIGTSGSGLVIYNPKTNRSIIYNKSNSALISNSIYSILPDEKNGDILISTENGLSRYYTKLKLFKNWTSEQGLMTTHFNAASGTITGRKTLIFGSIDGAVEFNTETDFQRHYKTCLVFDEFELFYQTVYAGEVDSPLTEEIDETGSLTLKHNQNMFSIRLSSINYDYPSNILYSWKLDGFYHEWSKPETGTLIRYTNLSPGKYTLRVRAVSNEDHHLIEERKLRLIIEPPFWLTIWAMLIYILILGLIGSLFMRFVFMKREREISNDKINFFVNTAHDLRTPLTLVKAPLDEIVRKENLTEEGKRNVFTAITNINNLLTSMTNLINFEKASKLFAKLNVSEYELRSYMEETMKPFYMYVGFKHINLSTEFNFTYMNVWFDRERMDSIIKNLVTNAIKYTPPKGLIRIITTVEEETWSIEVKDTGIGIPANEQKKLFKMFFRGSNAVNSKIVGSGIGLLLIWKLVRSQKGTIHVKSVVNEGSSFTVTFPQGKKHFRKNQFMNSDTSTNEFVNLKESLNISSSSAETEEKVGKETEEVKTNLSTRLLIVEDNDDLRNYLRQTFSEEYQVFVACDGKEGLELTKAVQPSLVISDIMMPEMRGDELCVRLKSDIETSHIPVILLTALSDKNNILNGLMTKADEYVTKPFDIAILKATIKNILENRALLKKQYAQLNIPEPEASNCTSELDYLFMAKVKETIEKNMSNSEFSINTLCSALNMSRSSLYNKTKALTGQSPLDFVKEVRMNKAAVYLLTKKYPISEVADMTGFNDVKYFRQVFKNRFGMNPSEYMNNGGKQVTNENKTKKEE